MSRDADVQAIRSGAHELTGAAADFDPLVDRVGDAGCVLLGEATHGTSEFYAVRAHITRRLVEEKGFRAVAVEADEPDARRAGRWAGGADDDPGAAAALGDFTRFPSWTWRNREVVAFLEWLRAHNAAAHGESVGFHGLDLASLHAAAGPLARVGPESWNARDRHMAETLDTLRTQLSHDGAWGEVVVWAHNSHVGDARATEQAELGQLTLGQLARETYGEDAVLVGLGTFTGTVTAACDWDGPATAEPLAPARADCTDALLHETGLANLLLVMGEHAPATAALAPTRLQRAIGAVYRPETERVHHYVFADVTRQFDALVHLDTTSALQPL